jgi:hypothetical protein
MKRALSIGISLSVASALLAGQTTSTALCSPSSITDSVPRPERRVERLASPTGLVEGPGLTTLHIRLYNHAGISSAEIERMTRTASRVLGEAGISLTTVRCLPLPEGSAGPAECGTPPGPADMVLEVLGSPPRQVARHALSSTLGSTKVSEAGPMASQVYYTEALDLVAQYGLVQTADLLGHVVAHEIGHAVLGAKTHSTAGIMKAVFTQPELQKMAWGRLHFSPLEARMLRASLQARSRGMIAQDGKDPISKCAEVSRSR